jgi:hypothetical protein
MLLRRASSVVPVVLVGFLLSRPASADCSSGRQQFKTQDGQLVCLSDVMLDFAVCMAQVGGNLSDLSDAASEAKRAQGQVGTGAEVDVPKLNVNAKSEITLGASGERRVAKEIKAKWSEIGQQACAKYLDRVLAGDRHAPQAPATRRQPHKENGLPPKKQATAPPLQQDPPIAKSQEPVVCLNPDAPPKFNPIDSAHPYGPCRNNGWV